MSYILLTVRSWDVAEVNGPRTRTRAQVEQAYPGLAEKLDGILDRVQLDCPDTVAALEAARKLVQIIRAFQPRELEENQPAGGGKDKKNTKEREKQPAPASATKPEKQEREETHDLSTLASGSACEEEWSASRAEPEQPDDSGSDSGGEQAANVAIGEGGNVS